MNTSELYQDVQGMLSLIKDDKEKLMATLSFLESQELNEGENPKEHALPEEYRNTILQITDALETGFVCFLNPITLEIEQVTNRGIFDLEEFAEQNDDILDEYEMNYIKWDDSIKFEPLIATEVLLIMQKFVTQLPDSELSRKLESVLGEDKPVTKFRKIIEQTDKNDAWKAYLHQATIDYVRTRLLNEMRLR